MPKAFIICTRLKETDNVGKYYAEIDAALKQDARRFGLTISTVAKLKEGERLLPLGFFKATGTASIDDVNALANSAARSGTPDFVAVFEITDSPESIRLSYPDRVTATKTKPPPSSP